MRIIARILLLCTIVPLAVACTQPLSSRYDPIGRTIVLGLSSSPFPHPDRSQGHTYGDEFYPAAEHYRDSTVGVFIPSGFDSATAFDLIVHVHGWRNNVDSVFAQFGLAEQLAVSGRNAILVVPQGPKNAPDSFGGKLEGTGAFARFIADVLRELHSRGRVGSSSVPGIVLSGHSGAYRMISFILARGGLTDNIKEVYLFDALYGQLEKFAYWLDHYDGRFVAIYTDGGGTKATTESLMEDLDAWGIGYRKEEEGEMKDSDLHGSRILFIPTDLGHNEVLSGRGQFEALVRTGAGQQRRK